jgi:hypothetical protein
MFRILFISLYFALHPVHVSVTSIEYDKKTDGFKLFMRMYFDDFIRDGKIDDKTLTQVNIAAGDSVSENALETYLNKKIILTVNGNKISGKLKDAKIADNEISMNFFYHESGLPGVIKINNFILTNLYKDQSNMLIMKVNDFEEGVKLSSDQTEYVFNIK